MDEIIKDIELCIESMIRLSNSWEKTEWDQQNPLLFERLTENYPFNKDLYEVIHDLIQWKEKIIE